MADDNDAGDVPGATPPEPAASGDGGNVRSPSRRRRWPPMDRRSDARRRALPLARGQRGRPAVTPRARSTSSAAAAPQGAGGTDAGGAPSTGEPPGPTAGEFETVGRRLRLPVPVHTLRSPFPYTQYPFVTIGKVFFTQNGKNYVASAASIGNHAILTAGHVVHAGDGKAGGWSTNLVFVPAYRDNVRPLGTWAASWLATRTNWFNNGNPGGLWEDIGGAVLHPLNGRKISEAVGWLGFSWNWPREQHWFELGYPAAPPFTGGRLNCVAASYAYNGSVPGPVPPVATGNDMTGGCSGGPWIRGMFSGSWSNGVNSYRQTRPPTGDELSLLRRPGQVAQGPRRRRHPVARAAGRLRARCPP